MRLSHRVAGALVAALLAAPVTAAACSCTYEPTLQEEFDSATRVFSGRVLWINPSPYGEWNEVMFEPLERWKGPMDPGIVVVTGSNDGVCGNHFEVGGEYLLFCWVLSYGITLTPMPFTHSCSRTAPLEANPWISLLPPPVLPVSAARPTWGALKTIHR